MTRGLAQAMFTGPFYAGVAYSAVAWISLRMDLYKKVCNKLEAWEEWKFGNDLEQEI
jgi:hypothetical protein